MHLQTYPTAVEFLYRVQPFLEADEAVNNLMLGLSLRLVDDPFYYGGNPFFATVESGDVKSGEPFQLAALRTPPHNLILYAATPGDSAALAVLVQELQTEEKGLPGVLGPVGLAAEFAHLWVAQVGGSEQLVRRERVYELRQVNPIPMAAGSLRKAQESDLELLRLWTQDFNRQVFGQDMPEQQAAEMARKRLSQSYLWEDGCIVSLAAVSRNTPHGAVVGPVYTPPEQRGRGYASACVASLSQLLLDQGYKFCALYTDLANPTSNHIYQVIGYQPRADFSEYRFS